MQRSSLPRAEIFPLELARINSIPNFSKWIVLPGMEFDSSIKWWANGDRRVRHVGLDFQLYEDKRNSQGIMGPNSLVPNALDGRVAKIFDDQLGKTICVALGVYQGTLELFALYGHTEPFETIVEGALLRESDLIASTAEPKSPTPPHLHVTFAWLPRDIPYVSIDWSLVSGSKELLVDPFEILGCQYIHLQTQ